MKLRIFIGMLVMSAILACSTSAAFPPPDITAIPSLVVTEAPQGPDSNQAFRFESTAFHEDGSSPSYTIDVQIPFLQGLDDARVAGLNTQLKALVQNQIDRFKNDIKTNTANPPVGSGSYFDLKSQLVGHAGNFWSIKLTVESYFDGAAHPGHYSVTYNYDLEKGQEVSLDKLFVSGSDYLKVIADYCKAQLGARDIGFDAGFNQGADPTPENYQRWNISDKGLIVTFDEYQVAPYAAGPQEVIIPFGELSQVIDPKGEAVSFLP